MPPIKKPKHPSPNPPDKVSVLQENIRLVAKEVRAPVKSGNPDPGSNKVVKFATPVVEKQVSSDQKQKRLPRDNPYAREVFFCKTNVRQVAREEVESLKVVPQDIETASKSFRHKLFRVYVEEPRKRVLNPLYKVRFDDPYYEYRCHLALAKGLCSEEDYQDYKTLLDGAGIPECWVDMSKNNLWMYHQNRVVTKVRRDFKNWNTKLEKLPQYVMNEQRRFEIRQAKKRENRPPELLDALLKRSNAVEFMPQKKIKDFYQTVFASNPTRSIPLPWLVFQNDELNRKYGLGRYLQPAADEGSETDSEAIVGITPLDQSVTESESVRSEGSEIDQMRSEMAMTQPTEVILPGGGGPDEGGPFYQNTEEVITALEPTQQQQQVEAFAMEPVPSLVPPDDSMDVGEQQQAIVQVDPEDEPMPQQQEPEPAVAERQSGEEGSDFSLLTPGQQEVILITDDSPEPSSNEASVATNNIKDEVDFWTNLQNVRNFTNIDKFIEGSLRKAFEGKMLERKLAKLDTYVEKFFKENLATFRAKRLPVGILKLSRKERREREGVVPQPAPTPVATKPAFAVPEPVPVPTPAPTPTTQTPPVTATPEPLFGDAVLLDPLRDTPRPTMVPTVARRIDYENSPESIDTMPDSESFLPEICSTQVNYGGPMIGAVRHPGTPRPSPQRPALPQPSAHPERRALPERQSVDSRASTPAFAKDLNETVLNQSPRRPQRSSPRVKIERDNHSGYEDEVIEIPISNDPIPVDDSLTSSQIDPNALIDKMAQDDGVKGVPAGMQKRVDGLFQHQTAYDVTQNSQNSDGSGGGKLVLSQHRQSMGFHNSQSPRARSK